MPFWNIFKVHFITKVSLFSSGITAVILSKMSIDENTTVTAETSKIHELILITIILYQHFFKTF